MSSIGDNIPRVKMTRAEALARGRTIGAPAGGKAVAAKTPPDVCPRCGKSMMGRSWMSYLGHLGLHKLADRYFNSDIEAAQQRLRENGQARQDPVPENGAFRRYRPIWTGHVHPGPTEVPF